MGLQQKTSFQSVFKWMMLQPTLNKQCFAQMFRISTSRRGQLMQPYIYIIYISQHITYGHARCLLLSLSVRLYLLSPTGTFYTFFGTYVWPGHGACSHAHTQTHKHSSHVSCPTSVVVIGIVISRRQCPLICCWYFFPQKHVVYICEW